MLDGPREELMPGTIEWMAFVWLKLDLFDKDIIIRASVQLID